MRWMWGVPFGGVFRRSVRPRFRRSVLRCCWAFRLAVVSGVPFGGGFLGVPIGGVLDVPFGGAP